MSDQDVREPLDLDARYGRTARSPAARTGLYAVAVVLGSGLVGFLVWVALHAATPEVGAAVLRFTVADSATVTVELEVRRDPTATVRCDLVAFNAAHLPVGRREVLVPAGGERTVGLSAVIETAERSVGPEIEECSVVAPVG